VFCLLSYLDLFFIRKVKANGIACGGQMSFWSSKSFFLKAYGADYCYFDYFCSGNPLRLQAACQGLGVILVYLI
jgi:hypothetical protein